MGAPEFWCPGTRTRVPPIFLTVIWTLTFPPSFETDLALAWVQEGSFEKELKTWVEAGCTSHQTWNSVNHHWGITMIMKPRQYSTKIMKLLFNKEVKIVKLLFLVIFSHYRMLSLQDIVRTVHCVQSIDLFCAKNFSIFIIKIHSIFQSLGSFQRIETG